MTRLRTLLVSLLVAMGSAVGAHASKVTATRLPDGLLVLTKEVHAAPVVCTYVWYRTGSRNETTGETGISHQLEHMMFKGTKRLFPKPGYIDLLLGRYGGQNNAETNTDTTSYYLLLPSDQLDLALRVEADRMTSAAIDPAQLKAENTVVLSELEGDENDNSYYLYENTRAAAYRYHPYHFPVIGTKWDVQHLTRDEVYSYYHSYYAPNNATLVIVGDFDTSRVLSRVRQLWSGVSPQPIPHHQIDPEPPQRGERRVTLGRAGANSYVQLMYHIPRVTSVDLPPLAVLATALSAGRSSVLYKALVEKQLATDVSASANEGIDPETFEIAAVCRSGVSADQVSAALLAELEKFNSTPLDARALQKAKNQTRAQLVFEQDSVLAQAARLGFYQTVAGDWRYAETYLDKIDAVTAADVGRVAHQYLTSDNRTVGLFTPTGSPTSAASDSGAGSRGAHYRPAHQRSGLPAPAAGRSSRSDATFAGPPRRLALARPVERRLANGMRIVVQEDHANPSITISGFVRAGSVNDPVGKYGLATVTSAMLTRGAGSHSSQEIAATTDFLGAVLGYSAERERMDISAEMLKGDFDSVFGILAETLRSPTFPDDELAKVKGELISGLENEAQDTGSVVTRSLYRALYPSTDPYEHAPEGRIPDVGSITVADVRAFHVQTYRPDQTVLTVVGDIESATVFAAAEKYFGDWTSQGTAPLSYQPTIPSQQEPPAEPILTVLADKSQDDIAMGQIGIPRSSPHYVAAAVMNLILGGDEFVGRIGKRVRDTEGLAYYAVTEFTRSLAAGPWMFRAGANPRNVRQAITSARSEIVKMVRSGPTAAELSWAKDNSVGTLRLALATSAGIAQELADAEFFGLGLDYYTNTFPKEVRVLSLGEVATAARDTLRPNDLVTAIAGPPVPGIAPAH